MGQKAGAWLQYKSRFTNMNVFSSMMSVEDMIKRTSQSGNSCYSPGDYLRLPLAVIKVNFNFYILQLGRDGVEYCRRC